MFEPTQILGFLTVSLLIAISPGPSWVYTISTTLSQGRQAGMIGNLGNSTGILCHALISGYGLSLLLQYSAAAFIILKWLGVLYLAYLALRNFQAPPPLETNQTCRHRSLNRVFVNGMLVSLFNPKIFLLMLALLPQFVDPLRGAPQNQLALMGAMHALVAGLVHTLLVGCSHLLASRLKQSGVVRKSLRWATGTLFLGFGAKLALARSGF